MYRIFCESYKNFLNTIEDDSYRLNIARPFELIVNLEKYKDAKRNKIEMYKRLSDLIAFMQESIDRFPKFKAFLWTLESRDIKGEKYNIETKEELEEQCKLINSFSKLAYWY